MIWTGLLIASASCYVLKLAGLSLPATVLGDTRVQRIGELLPIALLATLVVLETVTFGHSIRIDARLAGVAAGVVAQRLRAPFLVVVGIAAATAALLRAV